MKIAATIKNRLHIHEAFVETDGNGKNIPIPPKASGYGSSANGAELLLLALATCFCNDLYREAAKMNISLTAVQVKATGEFNKEGEAGSNFQYTAAIESDATAEQLKELLQHTDKVAEIQNTLRKGLQIELVI